ncbi:Tripartite tricarboxylate transporter (TTT) class transporter [Halalkaliarchaeum sp. AArc-CO]|uniref:tripartite tricarboxylate transporter permease n=1 Tax=unclassified Halalkaliarchaeum TaxID=2678344 RepID=UPI00217CC51E|nr:MULTISPECIES: tripartite tricarboxylate transporter permease [unclassified Halalkaliarchaeum]MDR5671892.1 tripartite tricarboxylate transporter permease [Halalkaliarchaeum sp. AArc-GB]UWG51397.1 Tripartite tricarboxylate transporter (TTT) class transporter [Halalkaliarchaeum sp. AArc-CO]
MDPVVRFVVDPGFALAAFAFLLAGATLGAVSGLVPGLHANNFALLLAGIAPSIQADPLLVGVAILAAGVVHTFLDIVPALALGVPDAAMAVAALPGHRLVIAGRGREALRLSAVGSAVAVALAVPLAIPVTWAMVRAYPTIRAHLPFVLAGVVAILLVTESSRRAAIAGMMAFLASGTLGLVTLDLDPAAPLGSGGMLVPLFTGLFGAPVLVEALGGKGVPPQADARITMRPRSLGLTAGAGSFAGALVGYLPGVSAAIASVLALPAVPAADADRGFIVSTSGANTANTVFALFALVSLGTPRTGVMVALERIEVPFALPVLLLATATAAVVGFTLVLLVGDAYLRIVGTADYTRVSVAVLAALVCLSGLFAGPLGVAVFLVSTLLGLIPPRLGARRVHLMGVLIVPLGLST